MDTRGDPWGKTIWDPKLKIPVFPHYNPSVTFKFPLEFGGYLLKIPVDGGDALIEGKGGGRSRHVQFTIIDIAVFK